MSERNEGEGIDAAGVGLVLAYPAGLRESMAGLAADWALVDEAVAAGSAGLVELGLVTAGLNGSVAVARLIGAGRVRGRMARDEAARDETARDEMARDETARDGGVAAAAPPIGERSAGDGAIGAGVGGTGAAPVFERNEGAVAERGDGVHELEEAVRVPGVGGRPESAAPVGLGPGLAQGSGVHVSAGSPGGGLGEAAAPVARIAAAMAGGGDGRRTGFEGSSDPVGAVAMTGGIAPVAGAMAGLRADVGAALRERAAVRGTNASEPHNSGSAAFSRSRGGILSNRAMDDGFGEEPANAMSEGAWAPQPAGRGGGGRSEGQTLGAVHLDGRLVGHWLSEGMAQAAGRPGAGTTFFDPRQAPAWTPSGAI